MFKRNWRTAVKTDNSNQPRVLWYASITEDMVSHLSPDDRKELMNNLSDAVEQIASEAGVGREYEHGQLKEGWSN